MSNTKVNKGSDPKPSGRKAGQRSFNGTVMEREMGYRESHTQSLRREKTRELLWKQGVGVEIWCWVHMHLHFLLQI